MNTNDLQSNDAAAEKAVTLARLWLLSQCDGPHAADAAFFAPLAQRLADQFTRDIPTACTDGRRIKWNPDFIAGLTPPQVRFVLLHEILHPAYGHLWRFKRALETGKKREANTATDFIINARLAEMQARGLKIEVLPDALLPTAEQSKLSEEEIYRQLLRPEPPPQGSGNQGEPGEGDRGQQPGPGAPGEGEPEPAEGEDQPEDAEGEGEGEGEGEQEPAGDEPADADADAEGEGEGEGEPEPTTDPGGAGGFEAPVEDEPEAEEAWREAVVQAGMAAAMAGRGKGSIAGGLAGRVTVAAPLDWRAETADFIRGAVPSRNDYTRSARRHATAAAIMPRRRVDEPGEIIVAVDTSGSVFHRIPEFIGAVQTLRDEMRAPLRIVYCDSAIQAEHESAPGDEIPAAPYGGGTDLRPPFERAAELAAEGARISGLIYLTDLDGPQPTEAPDCPVLWINCGSPDATGSVGRTVYMPPDFGGLAYMPAAAAPLVRCPRCGHYTPAGIPCGCRK